MPTNGDVWYIDTSALVKTVLAEAESDALGQWLADGPVLAACELIRVEAVRAIRLAAPEALPAVRRALATLVTLRLDGDVIALAADLGPPLLRSLDAIHLAAALRLGPDLAGVLTYDRRMGDAARSLGLSVLAPAA